MKKRDGGVTRRGFLSGSLAAGALVGMQQGVGAQAASRKAKPVGVKDLIDVHHHYLPPDYVKVAKAVGGNTPPWSTEISLEKMQKTKLATAMLSISNPGVEAPNPMDTPSVCRMCNDYGAKVVAENPRHFGLFASLPLPDVDTSLKELQYTYDTLHTDGIVLMSHYAEGRYIGDPAFLPVYEEMNRRKAIVFIHPRSPFYDRTTQNPIKFPGAGIPELPFDSTRAVLSLLSEAIPEKFPDIRFILPHAGGTLPFLLSRTALLGSRTKGFQMGDYPRLAKTMANFYWDLTNTVERPSIKAVLALAPTSKLLFGSDIPYGEGDRSQGDGNQFLVAMLAELPHVGLTPHDITAVARRNAEALFPRLRQKTT